MPPTPTPEPQPLILLDNDQQPIISISWDLINPPGLQPDQHQNPLITPTSIFEQFQQTHSLYRKAIFSDRKEAANVEFHESANEGASATTAAADPLSGPAVVIGLVFGSCLLVAAGFFVGKYVQRRRAKRKRLERKQKALTGLNLDPERNRVVDDDEEFVSGRDRNSVRYIRRNQIGVNNSNNDRRMGPSGDLEPIDEPTTSESWIRRQVALSRWLPLAKGTLGKEETSIPLNPVVASIVSTSSTYSNESILRRASQASVVLKATSLAGPPADFNVNRSLLITPSAPPLPASSPILGWSVFGDVPPPLYPVGESTPSFISAGLEMLGLKTGGKNKESNSSRRGSSEDIEMQDEDDEDESESDLGDSDSDLDEELEADRKVPISQHQQRKLTAGIPLTKRTSTGTSSISMFPRRSTLTMVRADNPTTSSESKSKAPSIRRSIDKTNLIDPTPSNPQYTLTDVERELSLLPPPPAYTSAVSGAPQSTVVRVGEGELVDGVGHGHGWSGTPAWTISDEYEREERVREQVRRVVDVDGRIAELEELPVVESEPPVRVNRTMRVPTAPAMEEDFMTA
ncbi:hypothetical protein HDU76_010052 [Blyttiomyces sp. JEL0837]|nr:hypothetical protein HDU76_010052 [Blyttiomyces sp. JEL0837]